MLVTYKGCNV